MAEEKGPPPESVKQLEILNFETHGALYGRFLLASLPKADIANIIDPANTTVEFDSEAVIQNFDFVDYNPVFENFSLAERKKQWEGRRFSDAYNQWQTEFTGFMTKITDSNRESALMIIMLNPKNAVEFTENDAGQLFNEFCKDGSNITNFIERVKTNLISDGKINPTNLQELLPHLEWIASGLFGKDTASQVVSRLIELESAIHNNPGQVMEIFNSNKERINTPTDDERRMLIPLYQSLLLPQESKTVTIESTPQPAPVTSGKEEVDAGEDQPPVAPTAQATAAAAETLESRAPAEKQETTVTIIPATQKDKSEHGTSSLRLAINGKDTGLIWYPGLNGRFNLPLSQVKSEFPLDLPPGLVFVQLAGRYREHQVIAIGGKDVTAIVFPVFPSDRWSEKDTFLITKDLITKDFITKESSFYQGIFDENREGQVKIRKGSLVKGPPVDEWFPISEMKERVGRLNPKPPIKE